MNPFTISSANESDIPVLLNLIRELAEFEHLTDELEVTADSLRIALFGERPVAFALLARVEGDAAGYAVYYRTFSTFAGRPGVFLDDLYVRPVYRRRGLGCALLKAVAGVCAKLGGRFEWMALRWNVDALRLYRNVGADVLDEWALLRMTGPNVARFLKARDGGNP